MSDFGVFMERCAEAERWTGPRPRRDARKQKKRRSGNRNTVSIYSERPSFRNSLICCGAFSFAARLVLRRLPLLVCQLRIHHHAVASARFRLVESGVASLH